MTNGRRRGVVPMSLSLCGEPEVCDLISCVTLVAITATTGWSIASLVLEYDKLSRFAEMGTLRKCYVQQGTVPLFLLYTSYKS